MTRAPTTSGVRPLGGSERIQRRRAQTRAAPAVRLAVGLVVALVLMGTPTAAGASCVGPLEPGQRCDDAIEQRPTSGWVLIPLGLGIGGVAAVAYLAIDRRHRTLR